jgi:O-acetyl-ADP-ribose deacetylase (regulator of RNase III)
MRPGDIHAWATGTLIPPFTVLNLATKGHWRQDSDIDDIVRGLSILHEWIKESDVESVALPAIGCGLGGLPWGQVKARILYEFEYLDHERPVHLMVFEPK